MTREQNRTGRPAAFAALAMLVLALILGRLEALAQETPAAPAETAAPAAEEVAVVDEEEPGTPAEGGLSAEELQALVAPIALYPDLVLVLTLQAALAPLDIVQADRFLADYAQDPSVVPDPDWDQSVVGLLNYPTVIHGLNADLDWTQTLGQAVLDQLEGVQDAIQDIRGFMRAVGALESNEQMTVIAEGDIIRIEPADPDAVFIPQYDPEALLASLYSTDVEPAAAGAEAPASAEPEAAAPSEAPAQAETGAEPEPAPAPAAVVPAAAPTYYPPPPIAYSDPSPSWLGTAATFAGGAVVGGLVGWAIADDDDDDHDHGDSISRGNVNIEDSNITINRAGGGGGDADDLKLRAENERLKREARVKEQREQAKRELQRTYAKEQPPAAATRATKSTGLATSGARKSVAAIPRPAGGRELTGRVERAKAETRPAGRTRPAGASGASVRPGDRKQAQATSAFGGARSASQTRRDSDRGLKSRSGAKTAIQPNRGSGGGGVFAQRSGGGKQGGGKGRRGKR